MLGLGLGLFSGNTASAQEANASQPETKAAARDGLRGLRPTREERASWSVPGMDRRIRIHPTDPTDGGNLYWYMHRPLLALVEQASPPAGFPDLPKIVKHVEMHDDGSATLTFRVLVSSPEFREFCRTVVIQQDKDNIAKAGGREDQVKVFPWPLERMVIDCKVGNSTRVLATGETDNLGSIDDAFDFDLDFSDAALSEFKTRAANNSIRFAFSYTFSNREIAVAEADYRVNSLVENSLARTLTADQRRGTSVVFQDQANTLKRELQHSIGVTIRATSKEVLPRVNAENIIAKVLELGEPVDLTKFDEKDPVAAEAAKYVTPLLDKYSVQTESTDKVTDEKEKKKTETVELDLSGTVGAATAGGKYKLENEKRDLLRKEHGISITENNSNDRFAAIKVTVYRVNKDISKVNFSMSEVQFVGMGASSDYLADTPVPLSFTSSQVLAHVGELQAEFYFDGVPPGTMLAFFGTQPPKGWAWADGKTNWPKEDWVAPHLQGKPLPDMTGRFPYGFVGDMSLGMPSDATGATKEIPKANLPQPTEGASKGSITGLSVTRKPRIYQPQARDVDGPYSTEINGNATSSGKTRVSSGAAQLTDTALPGPWQFKTEDRTIGGGSVTFSGAELLPPRLNCRWIIRLGRSAPAK